MTILTTIATWFGMDYRRVIYTVAIPLALVASYLGCRAFINAKIDAAVDRARSEWIADQRAAEQAAATRAEQALTASTKANRAKQRELDNAAQKGSDDSVGVGVNGVLDGLSGKTTGSR